MQIQVFVSVSEKIDGGYDVSIYNAGKGTGFVFVTVPSKSQLNFMIDLLNAEGNDVDLKIYNDAKIALGM